MYAGLPREEIYSLTAQLRRASYSVPANIVEGVIQAVEKGAGKLRKVIAATTSLIVISLMHWSSGPLSVIS